MDHCSTPHPNPTKEIDMKTARLTALAIAASLLLSPQAFAVDTVVSKDAPDLASARTKIKAKDFAGAIAELTPMLATHQHADVYNLLGFSQRKSGDLKQAATFYAKALDFNSDHKGALEYQGEMFLELGDIEKAKINLARLVRLCPAGCEEREDLEKALAARTAAPTPKTN
jgi:tetratricopeptide (TPR) repeat protein